MYILLLVNSMILLWIILIIAISTISFFQYTFTNCPSLSCHSRLHSSQYAIDNTPLFLGKETLLTNKLTQGRFHRFGNIKSRVKDIGILEYRILTRPWLQNSKETFLTFITPTSSTKNGQRQRTAVKIKRNFPMMPRCTKLPEKY